MELNLRDGERGIYSAVIRWALIVAVFLMPLFFLPWTTSILELNKQILLIAVAGAGLVAWLLSVVSGGKLAWRKGVFDIGVLAILGATLIATIFSISRFASLFGMTSSSASSLYSILAFTLIYFLIVNTSSDQGSNLSDVLSVSVTLALVYGLAQMCGLYILHSSFASSHAFNTVGSVNALGVVAAISLPLLGRSKNKNWTKYVKVVGVVAALAVLIVLNWWILWTIAIAGMVALIVFESSNGERFSLNKFVFPMTVIVLAVFLLVVNFNLAPIKNNLPVEVAPSFTLSGHIVKSVLKESLITGYGPENFILAFDKYGAGRLANSTLSDAQFLGGAGEVFNAIVHGGLVMIIALLALAWTFVAGFIYYFRHKSSLDYENFNAIWASLVALSVAFFIYPFNTTLMFVAYALMALASLALWKTKKNFDVEEHLALSLSSSLGFIGGLILVLVGIYFGMSGYFADAKYASALTDTDINQAASNISDAVNWNSSDATYYRAASQVTLGLLSQELNKKVDPKDTQHATRLQNYVVSAINLAKTATDKEPQQSANWNNLGVVYQNLIGLVNGVDSLSEQAFLKAASLRPGDASFYNEIGSMYLTKANFYHQLAQSNPQSAASFNQVVTDSLAKSEANFKQAVDIANDYGIAIYNLGLVYDQEGKLSDAISQLEKIAPFNSDQPNLLFELGLLYYRAGSNDKAFSTMQQVLVLSPDFANAHWYLSLLYEEKGDIPNAIAELQKILSVDANKDNQTVLDRLAQLQKPAPVTKVKGIDQKPL